MQHRWLLSTVCVSRSFGGSIGANASFRKIVTPRVVSFLQINIFAKLFAVVNLKLLPGFANCKTGEFLEKNCKRAIKKNLVIPKMSIGRV